MADSPPDSGTTVSMAAAAVEEEKRAAAEQAAGMVQPQMRLGLGTGTTVAYLLQALAQRRLSLRCVATSPETALEARRLGLRVESFRGIDRLDMAIDGADQVDPAGWLVKGGGGAHTREKLVAAAAERFVVIVSSNKVVERLVAPVPLELMAFGLESTLRRLSCVRLRDAAASPDGGVLAYWYGPSGEGAPLEDPAALANYLSNQPGVVEHGLFPPSMVDTVLVGRGAAVERLAIARA